MKSTPNKLDDVAAAAAVFDEFVAADTSEALDLRLESLMVTMGAERATATASKTALLRDTALMLAAVQLFASGAQGRISRSDVKRLMTDADQALKLLAASFGRLTPLLSRRHEAASWLADWDGAAWEAAWFLWQAVQLETQSGERHIRLLLKASQRSLRLGQTALATEALTAIPGHPPAVLLAQIHRLAGEHEAAAGVLAELTTEDESIAGQVAWEKAALAVATSGQLDSLFFQAESKTPAPAQVILLSLWVRAVKGRQWWDRVAKPSTIRHRFRREIRISPALLAAFEALTAIETCYDSTLPLERRLANLAAAVEARPKLPTVEHELLVLAGVARALTRHGQPFVAAGVIQEYKNLSLRLSQGKSPDVLTAMGDLVHRGLMVHGESLRGRVHRRR